MKFAKRIAFYSLLALLGTMASRVYAAPVGIPVSVDLSHVTFTNGIGGIGGSGQPTLTSGAVPPQVVIYKPMIVPVRIANTNGAPLNPKIASATLTYTLVSNGVPITSPANVNVTFSQDPTNPNGIAGVAYVPPSVFQKLQPGDIIQYYVTAHIVGQTLQFGTPAIPYTTTVIDSLNIPVAAGNTAFTVPDLNVITQPTAASIPTPALPSAQGTLTVQKQDPVNLPSFKGSEALSAFTLTYSPNGSSGGTGARTIQFTQQPLSGAFQYTLSYPADLGGNVILSNGQTASPFDLAPACYDSTINDWRIMGRPNLDTTKNTITFYAQSLATCALFPVGALSASDVRPMQKIITPNGDGINDSITFTGLSPSDEVKIFDVRGRRVRTIHGPIAVWDGTDDGGKIVQSGVYLYQYTLQGSRVSGVIVVAK